MSDFGRHLGPQLCEAWGLDPYRVRRVTIVIEANTLPLVEVEMYADDQMSSILTELHELVPKGSRLTTT